MAGLTDKEQARIEDLLGRMTLREKVALLSGIDNWRTAANERLGLPSLVMTDGPHGVRATYAEAGRKAEPATAFPTGVAMAASWDPGLIERVGAALGEETAAMGCDILLGPCVNIVRTPLAGRNFETYSEDPILAGRIAAAYIKGVQSRGVGASLKHFACNNQETERFRGSSVVDERTLREIYLPAFETAVKEADPWTVMCAYNRINGEYASQNRHLLLEILKDEWGYPGVIVSDWNANHTTVESMANGLDLEMPGPPKHYGELLVDAVQFWQIHEECIDDSVRRLLALLIRAGRLDGKAGRTAPRADTAGHQVLARELAAASITLLKNEGDLLPLRPENLHTLAVIGPNAAEMVISGGGSSQVEPPYQVNPLEALRARLDGRVKVEYERGCDNFQQAPALGPAWFVPPNGEGRGLLGEYFQNTELAGEPVISRIDRGINHWLRRIGPDESIDGRSFSIRWTGRMIPAATGPHLLKLDYSGKCRFYLDGDLIIDGARDPAADTMMDEITTTVDLRGDRTYDLRIEYVKTPGEAMGVVKLHGAYIPRPEDDPRPARAAALAARADAAVVFAGMAEGYETEGVDRPHMDLPGRQNELIAAVAAANPRTIVVLNCGAPVAMPWIDRVPAVLSAYYPGQEGGNALADILLGAVNPSGKLPVTFPIRLEDTPAYTDAGNGREVIYGEGIFVGYRYYGRRGLKPLFPFGHGLSYTMFEYGPLRAPREAKIGEAVPVSLEIKNVGGMAGKETVQIYVGDAQSSLPRPAMELKAFAKVELAPGERRTVEFLLASRAFAFYHPYQNRWLVEPGEFTILAGSSSADIRSKAVMKLI